jgi:AcrR family transcriptional regulator
VFQANLMKKNRNMNLRKMSTNPRRAKQMRKAIVEATARIIVKNNSPQFTLEEVADQIDASVGTIYYYFKHKGDVFFELNQYLFDLMDSKIYPILNNKNLPPRKRLEELIYTYVVIVCENWEVMHALWQDVQLAQVPKELYGSIKKVRDFYERAYADLVNEVVVDEGLSKTDPSITTLLIWGTLNSITMWYRKSKVGGYTPQAMADYTLKTIFGGALLK